MAAGAVELDEDPHADDSGIDYEEKSFEVCMFFKEV
jgi:hypothetical protein